MRGCLHSVLGIGNHGRCSLALKAKLDYFRFAIAESIDWGSLMSNEKEFTGLVSAITAPASIDNDGLIYLVFNLVDTQPPAPEVPYVLYIDTSKHHACKNACLVTEALITTERIRVGLEPIRKSRVEWVKKEH
jgi:hypothetical protein